MSPLPMNAPTMNALASTPMNSLQMSTLQMSALWPSLGLFLLVALAIVALSTFYVEPDDARALRMIGPRYFKFLLWCAAIVGVMLLVQRLFLRVDG